MFDGNLIVFTNAGEGGAAAALSAFAGPSAYEVAVKNGFLGSEADWLASLKGSTVYAKGQVIQLPVDAPNPAGFYDITHRYLTDSNSIAVSEVPGMVDVLPYANGIDEIVSDDEVVLTAGDFAGFKFTDNLFSPTQPGNRFSGDTWANPAVAENGSYGNYVLDNNGQSGVYPAIYFALARKFVITKVELVSTEQDQVFQAAFAHDVDSNAENGILSGGHSSEFSLIDFTGSNTVTIVLGANDGSPVAGENGFTVWFQHSNPQPIQFSHIRLYGKKVVQVENNTEDTTRLKLHRNYGTGGVDSSLTGAKTLMYVG